MKNTVSFFSFIPVLIDLTLCSVQSIQPARDESFFFSYGRRAWVVGGGGSGEGEGEREGGGGAGVCD